MIRSDISDGYQGSLIFRGVEYEPSLFTSRANSPYFLSATYKKLSSLLTETISLNCSVNTVIEESFNSFQAQTLSPSLQNRLSFVRWRTCPSPSSWSLIWMELKSGMSPLALQRAVLTVDSVVSFYDQNRPPSRSVKILLTPSTRYRVELSHLSFEQLILAIPSLYAIQRILWSSSTLMSYSSEPVKISRLPNARSFGNSLAVL